MFTADPTEGAISFSSNIAWSSGENASPLDRKNEKDV